MSRASSSAIRCSSATRRARAATVPSEAPAGDGDADRMLDAKEFGDREQLPRRQDSPIDTDYEDVYTGNGAGEGGADRRAVGPGRLAPAPAAATSRRR